VRKGFTLIELLVVIAIIAILAAILFPVFAQAKAAAQKSVCLSNLRQIGTAMEMYEDDYDSLLPDRRDLKSSLPGGYKPFTSWPPSDPRSGWALILLEPYTKNDAIWVCPSTKGLFSNTQQVVQQTTPSATEHITTYWMWRFDRPDVPTPLDDFWGKSEDQAVADLQASGNPTVGVVTGTPDVEMVVDPYFPATIPTVSSDLKSRSTHFGGRNRLFLDDHVKYLKDIRTNK